MGATRPGLVHPAHEGVRRAWSSRRQRDRRSEAPTRRVGAFFAPRGRRIRTVPLLMSTVLGDTREARSRSTLFNRRLGVGFSTLMNRAGYAHPVVCARRRVRRQVMFAKRVAGSGSYGKKRFNVDSQVRC